MLNRIKKIIDEIDYFLTDFVNKGTFSNYRVFYGATFTLAFLFRNGKANKSLLNSLLSYYDKQNKNDPEFHWEFNNYALFDYLKNSNDNSIMHFLEPIQFKYTKCTNWTLLRCVVKLMGNIDYENTIKEAKIKIDKYQLNSGLILDDSNVKSFQYHCFSMALVAELFEYSKDNYFLRSFIKGVEFIRYFILENGETLYVGRGQNQSFGYGTLIYILTLMFKYSKDNTILWDLERVISFLEKNQRSDKSFPLVINGHEINIPTVIDMENPEFVGWYQYNNYFDYLPFMGFFLEKAYEVLKVIDNMSVCKRSSKNYEDSNFIKIVRKNYEAILSKPGGYWTNDLPIPYIVVKGSNITPCYGGEQFHKSLYSVEDIPLPYCISINRTIRWKSLSFFVNRKLWLFSLSGIMKREFNFEETCVIIKTTVYSIFRFKHIYLFLDNDKILFKENSYLEFCGYAYSASGRLRKYQDYRNVSIIRIKIES